MGGTNHEDGGMKDGTLIHNSSFVYAKIWHELYAYILHGEFIKTIIMPLLQGRYESDAGKNRVGSSLYALRLCMATTSHDGGMDVLSRITLSQIVMALNDGVMKSHHISVRG